MVPLIIGLAGDRSLGNSDRWQLPAVAGFGLVAVTQAGMRIASQVAGVPFDTIGLFAAPLLVLGTLLMGVGISRAIRLARANKRTRNAEPPR